MTEVVIVDAVRTPIGRRNGGLSTVHPADLLGQVQSALIERTGLDPAGWPGRRRVRQPGRRAVLQHRPHRLAGRRTPSEPPDHIDTQCGSSQQAITWPRPWSPAASPTWRSGAGWSPWPDPVGANSSRSSAWASPSPAVLRTLRVHLAVRGGGAHRRALASRGRLRPVRAGQPGAAARAGPRTASPDAHCR